MAGVTDRNWGWDPETPNMRLVREGDRVVIEGAGLLSQVR